MLAPKRLMTPDAFKRSISSRTSLSVAPAEAAISAYGVLVSGMLSCNTLKIAFSFSVKSMLVSML